MCHTLETAKRFKQLREDYKEASLPRDLRDELIDNMTDVMCFMSMRIEKLEAERSHVHGPA